MTYGYTITARGWRLLAKLLAGSTLELTRIMVGEGRVADTVNPADLSDLVAPVALATSTTPVTGDTSISFTVEYRNDLNGGLDRGFWLNEYGVFALDPEEGEVMLYYATLGDYPQYVVPYDSNAIDVRRFPVAIYLSGELEVITGWAHMAFITHEDMESYATLTLLPMLMAETEKQIAAHNANEQAHPDIRNTLARQEAEIQRLKDMLLYDITGNAFEVSFDTLEGLIVEGVWNVERRRIEF